MCVRFPLRWCDVSYPCRAQDSCTAIGRICSGPASVSLVDLPDSMVELVAHKSPSEEPEEWVAVRSGYHVDLNHAACGSQMLDY